jgi:hypothetical protein
MLVEDEFEMVFECVAYESMRDTYPPVFCLQDVPQLPTEVSPVGL